MQIQVSKFCAWNDGNTLSAYEMLGHHVSVPVVWPSKSLSHDNWLGFESHETLDYQTGRPRTTRPTDISKGSISAWYEFASSGVTMC